MDDPAGQYHFYEDRKYFPDSYSLYTLPGNPQQFQYECPQKLQFRIVNNAPPAGAESLLQQQPTSGGQMFSSKTLPDDMSAYQLHGSAPGLQRLVVPGANPKKSVQDPSQKRAVRLMKNRIAVQEFRQRKKEYVERLEKRAADLQRQHAALKEELSALKAKYGLAM
ncbi:cyclic AMP-dependent transcription factor ATF-1-like isoform X1 [Synchiropus splendidus]|uniref:cyclic AMP-dependent transcription factor ATF-1-like isoform X1 n=1 Tax=Synchiropus splendidus TaxID=270530 RepID=UPI00237EA338|nr:cyclic AMP-dependent transcription factor ATF-1-like isoform X1 [Synchiropus splendidus]XP_053714796.1 cyclic AMP-dependent transcription factor ATF-1-like isoform X1 [Synchiropus splendidus]XP_053714797.1 cyclic AMP-dependent transcription factor ATF-1-like isoform X1 [Synchiropus splendidus]